MSVSTCFTSAKVFVDFSVLCSCSSMAVRARVPARYPLLHYVDLSHGLKCEMPIPNWHWAFAYTQARENLVEHSDNALIGVDMLLSSFPGSGS